MRTELAVIRKADIAFPSTNAKLAVTLSRTQITGLAFSPDRVTIAGFASGPRLDVPVAILATVTSSADYMGQALTLSGLEVALRLAGPRHVAVTDWNEGRRRDEDRRTVLDW